jgi:hypothetical protein
MADRNIQCNDCGRHVGIIRDAKLMKGLVFVCPTCIKSKATKDMLDGMFESTSPYKKNDMFQDLFGDIFNNSNRRQY